MCLIIKVEHKEKNILIYTRENINYKGIFSYLLEQRKYFQLSLTKLYFRIKYKIIVI
jgi:hypothetical protein